jgi:hypothetical protein
MASPYNGLFQSPTPITGGPTTITKNADGSTINSGGKNGTMKNPDIPAVHAPSSFTAPPAPAGSLAAGGKF